MSTTITEKSWDAADFAWSRNKVSISTYSNNYASLDSFQVKLVLGIPNGGVPVVTEIISRTKAPDASGNAIFEIQDNLLAYQEVNPPTFKPNDLADSELTYEFGYQLARVEDGVEQAAFASGTFKCLPSGLTRALESAANQKAFTDARRFLSTQPDPKLTSHDVDEFLYFAGFLSSASSFSLRVQIKYTDFTLSGIYTAFSGHTNSGKLVVAPTSYEALDIETNATKAVLGWSVWLINESNARVSEVFNYELIEQPVLEKKGFLFRNSLGGYDTLVCTGALSSTLASSKELNNTQAGTYEKQKITDTTSRKSGQAATGFICSSPEQLFEFVLSDDYYLQEADEYEPVVISSIEYLYSEKDNELIGLQFEYAHAFEKRLHTDLPTRDTQQAPALTL